MAISTATGATIALIQERTNSKKLNSAPEEKTHRGLHADKGAVGTCLEKLTDRVGRMYEVHEKGSRVVQGLVAADVDWLFRPTEPTDYAILQVFKDTNATTYSDETAYRYGQRTVSFYLG